MGTAVRPVLADMPVAFTPVAGSAVDGDGLRTRLHILDGNRPDGGVAVRLGGRRSSRSADGEESTSGEYRGNTSGHDTPYELSHGLLSLHSPPVCDCER
jgi:hypothetical protein